MELRVCCSLVAVLLGGGASGCADRLHRTTTPAPPIVARAPDVSAFVAVWTLHALDRRLEPTPDALGVYLFDPDTGWLRTIRGTPFAEVCLARRAGESSVCKLIGAPNVEVDRLYYLTAAREVHALPPEALARAIDRLAAELGVDGDRDPELAALVRLRDHHDAGPIEWFERRPDGTLQYPGIEPPALAIGDLAGRAGGDANLPIEAGLVVDRAIALARAKLGTNDLERAIARALTLPAEAEIPRAELEAADAIVARPLVHGVVVTFLFRPAHACESGLNRSIVVADDRAELALATVVNTGEVCETEYQDSLHP